jgi:hypothetical protein
MKPLLSDILGLIGIVICVIILVSYIIINYSVT